MLSTLVSKTRLLQPLAKYRAVVIARASATTTDVVEEIPEEEQVEEIYDNMDDYPKTSRQELPLTEKIKYWKAANDVFFGPDRDLKNYPHYETPKYISEKYNFYIIPSRWFTDNIYHRLGVSGCYSLMGLGILFIMSKELIDIHMYMERVGFVALQGYWITKFGWRLSGVLDDHRDVLREQTYEEPLQKALDNYHGELDTINARVDTQTAVPIVYEAKQENLEMQLEAQYRERLNDVYRTVKNRLDYQVARETAERKFEQDMMVGWIVDGVKASITPQQKKETIQSCIATLQGLSKTATV